MSVAGCLRLEPFSVAAKIPDVRIIHFYSRSRGGLSWLKFILMLFTANLKARECILETFSGLFLLFLRARGRSSSNIIIGIPT